MSWNNSVGGNRNPGRFTRNVGKQTDDWQSWLNNKKKTNGPKRKRSPTKKTKRTRTSYNQRVKIIKPESKEIKKETLENIQEQFMQFTDLVSQVTSNVEKFQHFCAEQRNPGYFELKEKVNVKLPHPFKDFMQMVEEGKEALVSTLKALEGSNEKICEIIEKQKKGIEIDYEAVLKEYFFGKTYTDELDQRIKEVCIQYSSIIPEFIETVVGDKDCELLAGILKGLIKDTIQNLFGENWMFSKKEIVDAIIDDRERESLKKNKVQEIEQIIQRVHLFEGWGESNEQRLEKIAGKLLKVQLVANLFLDIFSKWIGPFSISLTTTPKHIAVSSGRGKQTLNEFIASKTSTDILKMLPSQMKQNVMKSHKLNDYFLEYICQRNEEMNPDSERIKEHPLKGKNVYKQPSNRQYLMIQAFEKFFKVEVDPKLNKSLVERLKKNSKETALQFEIPSFLAFNEEQWRENLEPFRGHDFVPEPVDVNYFAN